MIFLTHIFLPPLPTILFFELVLRQAKCQGRLVGFMPLLMQNLAAKVRKKMEVRKNMMGLFANKICRILNKSLLSVTEVAPSTRGGGTFDPWKRHLHPLEVPPVPLGDSSYTPIGMSCVTHRRYRSTPLGGIGTRDKLYPYQMEALIVMKTGFSR